ncbi:hypothetical protein MRX96_041776 [Rhipicephalus microplus]
MRQFVQAFLVSRIMYGLPYHPVNRTQIIKLDRLLNEAKRMVTGLPRYTRLDALKSCSKLNNLTELIDMHIHTQETRLRATNAGRYTLMLLGYDINTLPMLPNKTPPWEITVLTDGKPLPLNMDPNQRARRLNYAKRHARATSSLPMTERVVYTDAALPADGTSNTCYATAWYDQTNRNQSRRYHASADAMYSTRAELVGILDYLEWALEMSPQTDPVHHRVYTDSQAAHRACANVLYTDPVLQKIRHQTRLLRECGHDVTIHWVPGHCGIPGNEKAHRLARAHLLTALARASDTPSTFLATPPELADPIADKHITKQRRAAYLTAVGNPLSIPLLPSKVFTRRESVLLRRIQAGTLLTPFLLNRFHRGDTPPPVTGLCSTCNCRADLNHLCWECPVYNPPRLRALATIKRGPWPSSLRTWACPEPSPPDRAIEFWRALIMFLQDPAAPPVGDRLRDSHKIQAIQAAPHLAASMTSDEAIALLRRCFTLGLVGALQDALLDRRRRCPPPFLSGMTATLRRLFMVLLVLALRDVLSAWRFRAAYLFSTVGLEALELRQLSRSLVLLSVVRVEALLVLPCEGILPVVALMLEELVVNDPLLA